jgi:hypothetical protein
MPGREQEPSFQLASGTTNERDNSYNISSTLGSIFYNTDTSNVEIRHEDPSNTLDWRDLVMNNKEQIDISGKLVVDGDVSFNAHLSAMDASFQNNVDISGKLVVKDDVSFNAHLSAMDASFHQDVTVVGNLYVDGSFNFGEVIKNITTVNNELLISTQVDISNHGTGPALSVTQYGDGDGNQLAVFDAGEQGVAFEIMYDGDSVFHKDVSFQNNVDISGKLVVDGDVLLNSGMITFPDGTSQTTAATTGDPTKIENGDSQMEIATSDGACVFTPNGLTAKKTTFAADGNITAGSTVKIPDPEVTTAIDNDIPNIAPTSTYTHFDRSLRFYRSSGDYREYEIGILGNNTNNGNILAFGGHGGGLPDPNIMMGLTSGGNLEIAGDLYAVNVRASGNIQSTHSQTFWSVWKDTSSSGSQAILWNKIEHNMFKGVDYSSSLHSTYGWRNNSNGEYKSGISGYYFISVWGCTEYLAAQRLHYYLKVKQGSGNFNLQDPVMYVHVDGRSHNGSGGTWIVKLLEGWSIQVHNASVNSFHGSTSGRNGFTGHLLYPI